MKKVLGSVLFLMLSFSLFAQSDSSNKLGGLFKKATNVFSKNSSAGGNLSSDEIVSGLKEALSLGAEKSGSSFPRLMDFLKMQR